MRDDLGKQVMKTFVGFGAKTNTFLKDSSIIQYNNIIKQCKNI